MGMVAVVNGSSKKALRSANELASNIEGLEVLASDHAGHSIALAREAAIAGYHFILAVGGDGTVNEVVNGIMQAKADQKTLAPALCVVPAGTANDLAHSLGAKANADHVKQILERGKTRMVDLGIIQQTDQQRYFINIASAGLGGAVVHRMGGSAWMGANLKFMWAIARTFLSYRRTTLNCHFDGQPWKGEALVIAIANGQRFGSGIYIAPHAQLDDGLLEVVVLGRISNWDYLRHIGKLRKGLKIEHPEVHYFSAREIRLDDPSGQTLMETDGELLGQAECRISVLPAALCLLDPVL